MELQPISLNTIPEVIIAQIKSLIAEGNMKPGDKLPTERELSERFGVGRSSVREAMMALAATGLVIRTREGTFVNPHPAAVVWTSLGDKARLTQGTIRDVFEARRIFELGIVALAAERASAADIAEIARWVKDPINDLETFKLHDVSFHTAIARAANNPFIFELYAKVQEFLFQTHDYYAALEQLDRSTSAQMYNDVQEQHRAVLTAIQQHDPKRAQAAMLEHFKALQASMVPGS